MSKPLSESDYLKTWALFFICSTAVAFLLGAIAGGLLGYLLGPGIKSRGGLFLLASIGLLVNIPVSYLFFRIFV